MSETEIVLGDGARTTLQIWGDSGPVLLCVHGMTSSRRAWERLGKALAGRYRVAAYDQRGHGDAWNVPGPMTRERGEADLREVAAALGEPIYAFVGHSWGGAVVIGAGFGGPAARVVAIDPMMRQAHDEWYDELLADLRTTFALEGDERDAHVREDYAEYSHDDVEGKVHALHSMSVAPIEGLRREGTRASWDSLELVKRFDRPLMLAVPGRGDGVIDPEMLDAIAAGAPPHVTISWFPGEGHNLHRTDFPEFERRLVAFLA